MHCSRYKSNSFKVECEEEGKMAKKAVYIASTTEYAGKSIVIMALALIAKGLGKKVGYFKPIGTESTLKGKLLDEDTEIMKNLLKLEGDARVYCPVILRKHMFLEDFSPRDSSKYINEILRAYEEASREKDIVLIEGASTLSSGAFLNCSAPQLAEKLDAEVLLVSKFKNDHIVDEILQAWDYALRWNVQISGVLINQVPKSMMNRTEHVIKPILEDNDIKVLGIIPEDRMLGALTVKEIHEAIGGNILAGKEGMDKLVETVLVGAMTPESAMRYFQKAKNELVITGGDRTDIVFAALEAGATAVILTGNLYPSIKIFPRADELAVPLILVPYDTYTTLQIVQSIVGRIKPNDQKRIERAKRLIEENIEWKQILLNCQS